MDMPSLIIANQSLNRTEPQRRSLDQNYRCRTGGNAYRLLRNQGWTGVSKAARENVRNGPKFAKTIYLNIDNGRSKLGVGTACTKDVQRRQSGLKSGEVVDPGKINSIFPGKFSKNIQFFHAKIGHLQLLL